VQFLVGSVQGSIGIIIPEKAKMDERANSSPPVPHGASDLDSCGPFCIFQPVLDRLFPSRHVISLSPDEAINGILVDLTSVRY
jgi:hypothetical protein